jgi:uncharacterized protein (TIGR02996 family)
MTESELLREILANPAENEPRRRYGELLEERGDPRGELIRIQIQLHWARVRQEYYDQPGELFARERALLAKHGAEWSREVRPLVDDLRFERGFVDYVKISAAAFLERAEAIYAVAPAILLYVRPLGKLAEPFFASPHLSRTRALALGAAGLDDAGMRALAASPNLGNLRWLDVSGNHVTEVGMEALFATTNLPDLRYVSARDNDFNDGEEISDTPISVDGDFIFDWGGSKLGFDLEKKYGEKRWLHYRGIDDRYRVPWMSQV